jgi:hypothetical protein
MPKACIKQSRWGFRAEVKSLQKITPPRRTIKAIKRQCRSRSLTTDLTADSLKPHHFASAASATHSKIMG